MKQNNGTVLNNIPERIALSEYDSKKLLKKYGVPVVSESVAEDEDEAVAIAETIGFPVVVKAVGSNILHKTDRKLLQLNLAGAEAVRHAVRSIAHNAADDLEGILIQPYLAGKREFIAGLFRDVQFGPVIVFGAGGIFAEALADVTFRLAPIREADAAEMMQAIKARALLGSFRGEPPVRKEQVIATLVGLSQSAAEMPEIAEIDINPLMVMPDGQTCAVDALIVKYINRPVEQKYLPPVSPESLGRFFYPRSIAFVGASSQIGKWGHMLFTITASGGFTGDIYLVNPKGERIAERTVFKSVVEIPGDVDLAVVTIPAAKVADLIPEFKQKGIRNMLLITSGFAETGAEGKKMEEMLLQKAAAAGILMVGPNTMGICNPHIHLYCTGSHVRPLPGSTAIVAQSGNMGTQLLAFAEQQAIGIRAFCGSGNEAMITIEDYLDAFEKDELTRTVMLYVESVKNGRRFFESACRVGQKKPIVLLKGGRSKAGNRAAASHTGALTSDIKVFDAMCRQAGIVKVERPMDLLDLAAAFSSLPLPKGNRVAIMTLGGGWGVVTADLCEDYNLEIPELPPEMINRFDKILPSYWSRANPVDIVGEKDNSIPMTVIEAFLRWDGCDAVINLGILGRKILLERLIDSVLTADPTYSPEFLKKANQAFYDFENQYIEHIVRLMEKYDKPVFGVSMLTGKKEQTVYRVKGSALKGVFFATPERAVKAFAKMVEYEQFLKRSRSKT
ncbi:MAG: acetate--CoA ligase family protein [Desulfobacterales bacterium]|nr:acetate--CoA ligase family protein [Desulfobacterales bacterium]